MLLKQKEMTELHNKQTLLVLADIQIYELTYYAFLLTLNF